MKLVFALAFCLRLSAQSSLPQSYVVSTIAGGAPAPAAAAASNLALGGLARVGHDPSGNVYFTALHSVYRLDPSGTAIRVAGNGTPGFSGDGGPATSAQLNSPQGVAVDSAGNIYIADTGNERIRLVSNGTISTFAGNGTSGSNGDYGDPLQAQLHLPQGLALDSARNLYIADSANNVIRWITGGVIYTFAGNHIAGFSHEGGPAVDAALNVPLDVAFDTSGNLYIADSGNGRIRQVSTSGVITTVVGGGSTYTEGGLATATVLAGPHGVAVDSSGNLYVADSDANHIYKVSNNVITNFAGILNTATTSTGSGITNTRGFAGDGGAATSAQVNSPSSVVIDSSGNIHFTDLYNARVRKIVSSGTISTVVGNGSTAYSGDGGSAQNALMNAPAGVAPGPGGVVYISDTNNQRIRRIGTDGTISTVVGNGTAGFAGDGAAASSAQVSYPAGLAVDSAGNVYFADLANQRVRKVSGGVVSTIAGSGTSGFGGDGGSATAGQLNSPTAVAADNVGNLYIADFSNNAIRKVSNGTISTLAGTGVAGYSGDNGLARQAQLNAPSGVAIDAAENVYVADSANQVVRKITPDGIITTFAGMNGNPGAGGDGGPAISAQLAVPSAIAVDSAGNVYITDASTARVRRVDTTGVISTIAGSGPPGYSGDNGPAAAAQFNGLIAIALDASGNIYLGDRANNVIRLLQPVSTAPTTGAAANSASNLISAIAPGESVTIYGSGIGPAKLTPYVPDSRNYVPMQTGGTKVFVNGVPAPVLYSWTNQVGIQVPYEVTPGNGAITVQYGDQVSLQLPVTIATSAAGLFTIDETGKGQAVAINEDGSLNTEASPASQGRLISVYATGYGLVSPVIPNGAPNVAGGANPLLSVSATMNGVPAVVERAGGDTGLPAGTIRIDIRVPAGVSGGSVPFSVQIGASSSQPGVTLAVR
jgi:uncharacterized protein (TIGR03437 family)